MSNMTFENILFEEKDNAGYITFNNPTQMNPLTSEAMYELSRCIDYCELTDSIRVLVLRGAGGNFTAGGNVKAMKDRIDKGIYAAKTGIRAGGEFITRLKNIAKPTIAWIEGAAAGVGCSIAMACDFSIADEAAKMVFAFINIGYIPDGGIVYMLHKAVGAAKTTELLMSGRKFSGAEAAEWGIITKAVPADQLEETVQKYVNKYANGPGVAYGQLKGLINRTCYPELNNCMQAEVDAQHICSKSEDHYEALSAFVEKKRPIFQGK